LVLAIERGEVQGRCNWSQSSLFATRPNWLSEKRVNVLLQYGMTRDPTFPDVPTVLEMARNDEQRAVIKFLFRPKRSPGLSPRRPVCRQNGLAF
jgi:hypothetical protein